MGCIYGGAEEEGMMDAGAPAGRSVGCVLRGCFCFACLLGTCMQYIAGVIQGGAGIYSTCVAEGASPGGYHAFAARALHRVLGVLPPPWRLESCPAAAS